MKELLKELRNLKNDLKSTAAGCGINPEARAARDANNETSRKISYILKQYKQRSIK